MIPVRLEMLDSDEEQAEKLFESLLPAQDEQELEYRVLFGALTEEDEPVGVLSLDSQEDYWLLDWMFVAPEARHNGVGTLLIEFLLGHMAEAEDGRPLYVFRPDLDSGEEVRDFLLETGLFSRVSEAAGEDEGIPFPAEEERVLVWNRATYATLEYENA